MRSYSIKLNTIEKVKEFVAMTTKYDNRIEAVSGRFVVDAKSLLGMFALNLTEDVVVRFYGARDEVEAFETELAEINDYERIYAKENRIA